jgi:hypothetical protein
MAIQAFPPTSSSGVPSGTTATRPSNPSVGQPFYNGTLGIIEIYTAGEVWSPLGGVTPDTPVSLSAVDIGTGIAYANGTADISFTVGGGGIPTEFVVTPSPATSPTTFTGSSSPVRVTGLTLGTPYSFTAQARNQIGTSIASAGTNSITATTVPQAPTIGTAVPVTGVAFGSSPSVTLPFTGAATGGKSITNYKYSTDGTNYTAFSPPRTTSPFTFASLTAGTSYSYRLKAVNDNGDSAASAVSTITAATVPQAPTIVLSEGYGTSGQVIVEVSPNNNGGSAITGYTVTASPGGLTGTSATTTIAVNGLTNNSSYTFTAVATNAVGNSTSSAGSSGTPISLSPTIATASGGVGNNGNTGGAGGSGGGSGSDSGNNGGAYGGYSGSNGAGGRPGAGQLGLGYGSGTNPYIPVGGSGLQNGQPSATYAGLGPNSAGAGTGTYMNQDNTDTRVSGYGRGSGGSEGGWVAQGSAGIDGLVAWTNTAGGSGTINDTTSSWAPPVSSNYTFYVIGGGGGGAGGYRGPGGSGYYATASRYLTTSNRLTVTIGTGGARGGRFGTGGTGGATSVVVSS